MDYLYSIGNILILLSLSFRKVLLIRAIFIVSDLFFLLYGLLVPVYPIAYWAVASLLINFFQIGMLIRDMIPRELSYELKEIKDLFFQSMLTSDFLRLIKLSHKEKVRTKELIIKGQEVKNLILITEGEVYVERDGATLKLGPYHFIGEMSYFSNGRANATIYAKEPVEYLYWRYEDLHRLQDKKTPLFMRMIEAMGKDIMLKMINQKTGD